MYAEFETAHRPADGQISLHLDNHLLCGATQNEVIHRQSVSPWLCRVDSDIAAINNLHTLPLQRRFEVNAQTYPGAPAIKCRGNIVTYGELDAQADELALDLQLQGLAPGSFSIVKLEPSVAEVRAILAILKAGGAYLQFATEPTPGLEAVVTDVLQPSFLFVREHRAALAQAGPLQVIPCREEAAELPHGWPDEVGVGASTPACAIAAATREGNVCIWMWTHRALAFREHAPGPEDDLTEGDAASACRRAMDLWRCLSEGAALTIPCA